MWGQPPRLSAGRSPAVFAAMFQRAISKMRKTLTLALCPLLSLALASCSPRDFLTRRLAADLISASTAFQTPQQFTLQTGIVANKDYASP